ncbi:MAG: metal-dependent transcriptional regulator [Desulfobacterales bacterium]
MLDRKKEKEEYLERLWEMKESGLDSLDDLTVALNGSYDTPIIEELASENLAELSAEDNRIALTNKGEDKARRVIRAHRIGERLIYDVFGGEFEPAACEFEHTITAELVDGICTLLGHPHECPHGMPIPAGDCCQKSSRNAQNQVIPLSELEIGQEAKVAYINSRHDDRQMHMLDSLQIKPRTLVKIHQRYPCFVVECEGAHIAMDDDIVENICVWSNNGQVTPAEGKAVKLDERRQKWWQRSVFSRH